MQALDKTHPVQCIHVSPGRNQSLDNALMVALCSKHQGGLVIEVPLIQLVVSMGKKVEDLVLVAIRLVVGDWVLSIR